MNIFTKINTFYYRLKDKKRYKKFKNCTIPYPFYDKKRNTFEWVNYYKDINEYDVRTSLLESLGTVSNSGLIYHFKAKLFGREKPEQELKYRLMVSHCHNFDEVVNKLYDYPETFEIPDEFLDEYSKQELIYLKQVKNYLLLIGLKDYRSSKEKELLDNTWDLIDKKKHKSLKDKLFLLTYQKRWDKIDEKEKFQRYENSKALEYSSYHQMWFKNDKIANAIITGKKNYRIYIQHSFSSSRLNEKYFIINSNYDYIGIVQIVSEEIIKFNELKESMVDYKLAGFKNFKDYKNNLLKEFKEECKLLSEDFTEDSLIKYVNLKVIKKL